jgi:hypothetical protein
MILMIQKDLSEKLLMSDSVEQWVLQVMVEIASHLDISGISMSFTLSLSLMKV